MKIVQPLPKDFLKKRFLKIFEAINKNLSVKLFGIPGSGKTSLLCFVIKDPPLLKSLNLSPKRHLLYLDLETAYLSEGEKILLKEVEEKLKNLNLNTPITFILDQAIFLQKTPSLQFLLAKNWRERRPNLNFIFIFSYYLKPLKLIKVLPLLKNPLLEETTFFPLFSKRESQYNLKVWKKINNYQLEENKAREIIFLSGGLASLIKSLFLFAKKNPHLKMEPELLIKKPEISFHLEKIYHNLNENQKIFLYELAIKKKPNKKTFSTDVFDLINLGLINSQNGKFTFFSPLFEKYLLNQEKPLITVSGIEFKKFLTPSEQRFISLLIKNKGKAISRDQAGEAIWQKHWEEKYSEWALDQIVSQIRKKMIHIKDKKRLVTIRGFGFRLLP